MFNHIYKNKKVLVIGHTGFKGSWLSLWLNQLGAEVAGFANGIPTHPSLFEIMHLDSLVQDFRGDIRNQLQLQDVFSLFQPEIVFHLAAKAIVRECYDTPVEAFETNVLGSVHVLECIRNTPSVKSCVMITSDKCYENVEWEYGYRESDRLGGKDPYSATKACAELAFSTYFRSYLNQLDNLNIASARAGNVIGGGDWARDRIVPDCIRAWQKGEDVVIRSPGATRPWQHVLEPLSGYLRLGQYLFENQPKVNGEPFNFGPGSDVIQSVEELIHELQKIWNQSSYTIQADNEKKEANLLKLCCDKALNRLNWQATLNFKETIDFTGTWYKALTENPDSIQNFTQEQIKKYQAIAKTKGLAWVQ